MKKIFLFIGLICFLSISVDAQNERIVNYEVDIVVNKDRSLDITEYIKIYAAGYQFKRGITRDLPTSRTLGEHGRQTVFYDIKSIEKDGEPVNYFEEKGGEEILVYVGSRDVFLDKGLHEYKIEYSVKNQIAFFDDYEELYWNAIGTNVRFPIDNANIRIALPEGSEIEETHIYTGGYGQQKEQVGLETEGTTVSLQSIEGLRPFEGVTASIIVPKGTFKAPSIFQRWLTIGLLIMSVIALIAYFIISWLFHGRDPKSPPVEPIYEAPDGLSPAACAYILKGYMTNTASVSSLIDMIHKGAIDIRRSEVGGLFALGEKYTLTKNSKRNVNYEEQEVMFHKLFKRKNKQSINGSYNSDIKEAIRDHNLVLADQYKTFINEGNNTRFNIIPFLWIVFSTAIIAITYYYEPYTEFAKIPILILYPILSIVMLGFYAYLIRKPTEEKLELRAKIKGLREYLSWTEQDFKDGYDIDMRDLEHFESLLPYAYALGVTDKWQSSFEALIEDSTEFKNNLWLYNSPHFYTNFGRTINTSSVPPSSSGSSGGGFSGGGGGGFSGGGGGGGGVGGW